MNKIFVLIILYFAAVSFSFSSDFTDVFSSDFTDVFSSDFTDVFSSDFTDKQIVDQIEKSLLKNYDKKPCNNAFEKILLEINKKSYMKILNEWKTCFNDQSNAKFETEQFFLDIIKILKKYTDDETVFKFKKIIYEMKYLCLENFNLYFDAVKENKFPENIEEINCDYIDKCMLNYKYFDLQKNLYDKEFIIKEQIKNILYDKKVKSSLTFYIFFYELVSKQREKTIKRLLSIYMAKTKQFNK